MCFLRHPFWGWGWGLSPWLYFMLFQLAGTYETMMESTKEISKQEIDIPTINEANKAHANIDKLADRHALNGLRAVTLPGMWGVVSLGIIASYLAVEGVLAALLGIIITLLIYSFFWAIFGDSVIAVYNVIKNGEYGGRGTSVFKGVSGAFFMPIIFSGIGTNGCYYDEDSSNDCCCCCLYLKGVINETSYSCKLEDEFR